MHIEGDGNRVVQVNLPKRIAPWAGLTASADLNAVGMKHLNETLFDPVALLPAVGVFVMLLIGRQRAGKWAIAAAIVVGVAWVPM